MHEGSASGPAGQRARGRAPVARRGAASALRARMNRPDQQRGSPPGGPADQVRRGGQTAMLVMVLGLSYKTAPLALLERVVFSPEALPDALATLHEQGAHGVILSTCNRVEIYALVGHQESGRRALLRYLADYHGMTMGDLDPFVYVAWQEEAVGHLFRVTCGL